NLVVIGQGEVMVFHHFTKLFSKACRVGQIYQTHTATGHFVFISRADASAGSADLSFTTGRLARQIQRLVIGQDQWAGAAQNQTVPNRYAFFFQLANFSQQGIGRQYNAVADHAGDAFTQNSGGDQVQYGFLTID